MTFERQMSNFDTEDIHQLSLSRHAFGPLIRSGITTVSEVGQAINERRLLSIISIGPKWADEIISHYLGLKRQQLESLLGDSCQKWL